MGLSGRINCPSYDFSTGGRLGMREESLWTAYEEHARRELANECPEHPTSGSWKFLKTPEWERIEDRHFGHKPTRPFTRPADAPAGNGLLTCGTCKRAYDPNEPDDLRHHTTGVSCSCSRCSGRPSCYLCGSSFCFCTVH
jgi:hypothetical protein